MKKNILLTALVAFLIGFSFTAYSQKDMREYKENAEKIRKDIWAWKIPEFQNRTVPAEYANMSSVVLARHVEISGDTKKKSKMIGLGLAVYRELTISNVTRELIKINDKSALADYSEVSYTQLQKRAGFLKDAKETVYVGIRVIKPDGKMKEINPDEAVMTKDEKNIKEAKIAVSDLQVGDMIDYFILKQSVSDATVNPEGIFNYVFRFYDDIPILHYSIHVELGEKYAIEYRSYNGAPDFKATKSTENDNILDLVKNNISPTRGTDLWTSPYRQLPIIKLNIVPGYKGLFAGRINARKPGEVYKNQPASEYVEDEMNNLALQNNSMAAASTMLLQKHLLKRLYGMKKEIPSDSLASEVFYTLRYALLFELKGDEKIDWLMELPRREFDNNKLIQVVNKSLKFMDIKNNLILGTSKYGPQQNELIGRDFSYMVQLLEGKKGFMGFSDVFSPAFYIPSELENNPQAVSLDLGNQYKGSNIDKTTTKIPGTSAAQNSRIENLSVEVMPAEGSLLLKRNTTLRGHYKSDVQRNLVRVEQLVEEERKFFGYDNTMMEELADGRKTKKFADELSAAFAEDKKKDKDRFTQEAKGWFEQEITDLKDPKIVNLGIRHNKPDFTYSSSFKMNGLVKKAGNNFIVEVGKLQGTPLLLSEESRKRTIDVYMPFARSLETTISIKIPDGYTAEGVAALNKKVENETGYFITEANSDGANLTIKIRKSYTNSFEKGANWEKLLAFIDAANDFSTSKILLKKK